MISFDIRHFEQVESTNALVKQAALEGAAEGLVVYADAQSAGRGSLGRRWESPAGGLYASLLLRPQVADPATITLLFGVAVRRALLPWVPQVRLKKYNDVLVPLPAGAAPHGSQAPEEVGKPSDISPNAAAGASPRSDFKGWLPADASARSSATLRADAPTAAFCTHRLRQAPCASPRSDAPATAPAGGADIPVAHATHDDPTRHGAFPYAKLCGILAEAREGAITVGFGLNIAQPAEALDQAALAYTPAYLADYVQPAPTPHAVLDAVLAAFAPAYKQWTACGFAPFAAEYEAALIARA